MEIRYYKAGKTWRADLKDLCGSPPIGVGKTKEEAVGHLFFSLLHQPGSLGWVQRVNFRTFKVYEDKNGF